MSNLIYPSLVGEAWPVLKEPVHSTLVQTSASGKEARAALYSQERYRWTIPYGYLNHDASVATADLQILMGFFSSHHGQLDSFFYSDPTDNYAADATIFATGDGSTKAFRMGRTMNGALHLVGGVDTRDSNRLPQIFINGSPQGGGYSINNNSGVITFTSAPGSGAVISASFAYLFRVRFADDSIEFQNEVGTFWTVGSVKLIETQQ